MPELPKSCPLFLFVALVCYLQQTKEISPRPLPVSGGSFTVREGHTVPVPEGIIQLILSQPVIPSTSSYFTHVQTDAFLPHKTGTQQSYLSSHPKALFTYKQLQSAQQRNIVYNHSSEVNPRTIGNFLASGRRYTYDDNRPYNKTSNRRFNFEDNSIFNSAADSSVEMFQVLREPREGSLRVEDATDATLVFFSRAQLERGRLMYKHSGSEVPRDEFVIERILTSNTFDSSPELSSHSTSQQISSLVSTSVLGRSVPVHVTVLVSKVNDEKPEISVNVGVVMWQEDTIILSPAMLEVRDNDSLPSEIRYECSEPNNGHLALTNAPSRPVTTFTQQDINRKRLFFRHSGPLVGGFSWRVTDGKHKSGAHVFPVTAKAINISLEATARFKIFPLTTRIISSEHLRAHFNNPQYNQSLFIIIKRQPKAGRVVMRKPNDKWEHAGTFTQEEVNRGLIAYEHLRSPVSLHEFDDFVFDIESPPLKILKGNVFNVSISIGDTHQMKQLLESNVLRVSEGGSVTITKSNLNLSALNNYFSRKIIDDWIPYLTTHISRLPLQGTVSLAGRDLYIGSSIDARDIESGQLVYTHDHSDTVSDIIGIKIHIRNPVDNRPILIYNNTILVEISSINDNKFHLERSSTRIVRYQGKILSNEDLFTSDADTVPEEIRYQIMSGPSNGKIVINNNSSEGLTFSQQDVDNGRISYTHDGTNSSSKFYFQVSDGGHTPKYAAFNIDVIPLQLKLLNHTIVEILQTSTAARISTSNLVAQSNEALPNVQYNVTKQAKYGKLYIDGREVNRFDQDIINHGDLIYLQSEMSASADSFRVVAWVYDISLPEIEVLIRVKPLIMSHPLQAVAGSKIPITLHNLNASELAEVTSSLPIYRVTRQPRFGLIKREFANSQGITNSVMVNEFTHLDLMANRVFYVVRKIIVDIDQPLHDGLHYSLMVAGADIQPANGVLTITIHAPESNILNTVNNPRQLRPGNIPTDNSVLESTPFGDENFFVLIVSITLALAVTFIILLVVGVYCSKIRKNERRNESNEFDAISLPPPVISESRPESFMTDYMSEFATFTDTNSPNTLMTDRHMECHTSQSESSLPSDVTRELTARELSPSLPQCKVTPIYVDPPLIGPCRSPSHVSQIYQVNAQTELSDDWNPYEQTKSINSPMLRKNQYWV